MLGHPIKRFARSACLHDLPTPTEAQASRRREPFSPAKALCGGQVFRRRQVKHLASYLFITGGGMKDEEIKDLLRNVKNVAVVGISPKEDRPSYVVASYLKSKGYRIIPVRPDGDEILGEKVYHSLSEIPKEIRVDVVDIFRKSEDVPPVVEEAVERGARVVWMQEGVVHKQAGEIAEKAGLKVIMDRCIKKEHQRLL
jgi:predicted CoA-binding protein